MKVLFALAVAFAVATPDKGWQPTDQVTQARRLGNSTTPSVFVPIAELKPTDRVTACPIEKVVIGGRERCPENATGRTDAYRLVSEVFPSTEPPPPLPPVDDGKGYIRVTINAGARPTQWRSGVPIQEAAQIWLRLYEDDQLIESVPWDARLSVVRTFPDRESSHCFRSGIFIDVNGNGAVDTVAIGDDSFIEEGKTLPQCTIGQGLYRVTLHAPPDIPEPEFERVRADEVPR